MISPAINTKGALPTTGGILSPNPSTYGSFLKTIQPTIPKTTVISKPTQTGIISKPKLSFSSSVLAQQQGLNKMGAGLKEDGLLGPLTKAAIQKYSSSSPTTATTGSTSNSKFDPAILTQQKALNNLGAGLKEDGILGPLTQAAMKKYGAMLISDPTGKNPPDLTATSNPPSTSTSGTMPGLLSGQSTAPVPSPYSPTDTGLYGKLVANLASTSQQPGSAYQSAQDEANRIAQQQTNLANEFAKKDQNINRTAGFLTQATGLEGQLQKQYDIGQEALAQQYAGATNRLGAANTQQGLEQQALGTAAGFAQPTTQFGVLTNPITGQPVNGLSAQDAAIQGGNIQGLQQGAQALGATGGTVTSQQMSTIAGYTSALQQAQNLQSQVNDLITSFGINPSDVNLVNSTIQKIASNTSDPRYKTFNNYVNDISSRYAQILTPPGGSATDTTRAIAQGMIDSTAKGTSIISVMKSLDAQAQAVIAGVLTKPQTSLPGQTLPGGLPSNTQQTQNTLGTSIQSSSNLRVGSSGQSVTQLQQALNAQGANLVIDGKFGPKTQAAVMQYQQSHGLTPDGIVGPKTMATLSGNTSTPTQNTTSSVSSTFGGSAWQ